jgi:hypothetical protein
MPQLRAVSERMTAREFLLRRAQTALRKALSPMLSEMECCARVAAESAQQAELWIKYRTLPPDALGRLSLRDVGFKAYSQSDEDGILLYLLALIGEPLHRSVEICAGDGRECNTANLVINHHWHGLMVDGDPANVARGNQWYARHPSAYVFPPRFEQHWVTRNNVNAIVTDAGFGGEIDVLSIDVDGVDYWLWQALDCILPRVVVIEFQCHLGAGRACTVPYSDEFRASDYPKTNGWLPSFAGASLAALAKLGNSKGYRLVGANTYGFNAFFLRNDLLNGIVDEVQPQSCLRHPRAKWSIEVRSPTAADLPWEDV